MSDDFPAELRAFIAQHIESLAQLEALLRLRQGREQTWDAPGLGASQDFSDGHTGWYWMRLAAFVLILIAIIDKNRR